jgi:hypothetical protein
MDNRYIGLEYFSSTDDSKNIEVEDRNRGIVYLGIL